MERSLRSVGCGLVLLLLLAGSVKGQGWLRGRAALQMKASSIEKSVAPGLHFDAHAQVAGRYSIVAGMGISSYILEGRRSGTYTLAPKLSFKVTRPSRSMGANTFSVGGGYHVPFGQRDAGRGPTVHLGVGRLWALRETTLFVDLRPTAVIRNETTSFLLPLRAGVVF